MSPLRGLSFGGGVQSVTLARMSLDGELDPLDAMIFADTQAELPGTYEAAAQIEAACHNRGVRFMRVTAGDLGQHIWDAPDKGRGSLPPLFMVGPKGERGFTLRKCTRDFKVYPVERAIKELAGKPRRHVEQWFGISRDEAERTRLSQKKSITFRYPLIERGMDRNDCLQWLDRNGYSAPIKSRCGFCPYQSNRLWREVRDSNPEAWNAAVAIDARVREHSAALKLAGTPYLHSDRVPLSEVDLRTAAELGQPDLFADECSGVCGV